MVDCFPPEPFSLQQHRDRADSLYSVDDFSFSSNPVSRWDRPTPSTTAEPNTMARGVPHASHQSPMAILRQYQHSSAGKLPFLPKNSRCVPRDEEDPEDEAGEAEAEALQGELFKLLAVVRTVLAMMDELTEELRAEAAELVSTARDVALSTNDTDRNDDDDGADTPVQGTQLPIPVDVEFSRCATRVKALLEELDRRIWWVEEELSAVDSAASDDQPARMFIGGVELLPVPLEEDNSEAPPKETVPLAGKATIKSEETTDTASPFCCRTCCVLDTVADDNKAGGGDRNSSSERLERLATFLRMYRNHQLHLTGQFTEKLQRFQAIQKEIEGEKARRLARHIQLFTEGYDATTSAEQKEEAMKVTRRILTDPSSTEGGSKDILALESLRADSDTGSATQSHLLEADELNQELKRIESNTRRLHQLFVDFACVVDSDNELLDTIATNTNKLVLERVRRGTNRLRSIRNAEPLPPTIPTRHGRKKQRKVSASCCTIS